MSRRKILFAIPSLDAGGAEKALVNLLNILCNEDYDIDLLLFKKQGIFHQQIPVSVKIITPGHPYEQFTQPLCIALKDLVSSGNFALAIKRLQYYQSLRTYDVSAVAEQQSWKYWSPAFPPLPIIYDVAVAFLEKSSIYYLVDKVQAKRKIGWIHNDYSKLGLNKQFDATYFSTLDRLVTVSSRCVYTLEQEFPELSDKISMMENVVSIKLNNQLANEVERPFAKEGVINVLSIGRLVYQKGFDMGIEAMNRLGANLKKKIRWYIIGEGELKHDLLNKIDALGLDDNIILLGGKSNPYPWLKHCDFYFQPSRFEGKSIAIDEAKMFKRPILVARFSTVLDQIEPDVTGCIVNQDVESLAEGLRKMITDEDYRNSLEKNLETIIMDGAEVAVELFNSIIEESH